MTKYVSIFLFSKITNSYPTQCCSLFRLKKRKPKLETKTMKPKMRNRNITKRTQIVQKNEHPTKGHRDIHDKPEWLSLT